ncbi:hypothetical protein FRB95_009727 [Tulasnella sp. JGI-2019a]|nr:hypothetical protein FRB95_009727 [Tulasnella sp. JGI-2019a]
MFANGNLKRRVRLASGSDVNGDWEKSFTGNSHCEARLAGEKTKDSGTLARGNSIGTSKRCCVYPWALPDTNIDPQVKQQILNKLKEHLKTLLDEVQHALDAASNDCSLPPPYRGRHLSKKEKAFMKKLKEQQMSNGT